MKYFDIHALERSSDEDITTILNLWVEDGSEKLLDDKPCSVGVHPDDIDENVDDLLFTARDLAHDDIVVAVGECGLDRSSAVPWVDQLRVFEDMISVSELLCKPLIIHCVRGHADVVTLHKELSVEQPWIIHGYHKGGDTLDRIIDAGVYVSFDASIMDESSPSAEALKGAPLDKIFLETGDQTDHDIKAIYEQAAKLRGIAVEELTESIAKSFGLIFGQLLPEE